MEPWWRTALRSVVAGRKVVLAGAVAPAWTEHLPVLREAGAGDFLVVATEGRGAGTLPDVRTVVVEPPSGLSMMERINVGTATLRDPPREVIEAVRDFDPDGDALVIGTFLNTAPELDGRPFLAHRRPEWLALEDKVVVDDFWDRAGVDRQPSTVVGLYDASASMGSFDRGAGTVWSADARDGFHGGGEHTHWVTDTGTALRATQALAAHCDRVRVMPFVDGVPMSIHGIVLPDGVAVLRPVEMVTLRRADPAASEHFFYAGCATFHDPAPVIREQMRDVATRVGRRLDAEVGFRGTFTVDGVVAADGFWPTELNPRFGAGINTIARAGGELPILLLNELIGAGIPIGRTAAELEAELVAAADTHRGGGTWRANLPTTAEVQMRPLAYDEQGWRRADDGDPIAAHMNVGAGYVGCRYVADETPVGPSTAGRAVEFWAFADRELNLGLGELRPAPELAPS